MDRVNEPQLPSLNGCFGSKTNQVLGPSYRLHNRGIMLIMRNCDVIANNFSRYRIVLLLQGFEFVYTGSYYTHNRNFTG